MSNIVKLEYDNDIIFTNIEEKNIDDTNEKYIIYKNFETLVKNIDAWEMKIKLHYEKETMKNTKYPFLLLGNYMKFYLAGYMKDGRELYQINISKEFLNQEHDAIIFLVDFKYIRYINGYIQIYFTNNWNNDYINQNEKIIIKQNKIITHIGNFTGDISLIKSSNFHITSFEVNKIYFDEHFDNNYKFILNRIVIKKEINTNNLAFNYVYEEE